MVGSLELGGYVGRQCSKRVQCVVFLSIHTNVKLVEPLDRNDEWAAVSAGNVSGPESRQSSRQTSSVISIEKQRGMTREDQDTHNEGVIPSA